MSSSSPHYRVYSDAELTTRPCGEYFFRNRMNPLIWCFRSLYGPSRAVLNIECDRRWKVFTEWLGHGKFLLKHINRVEKFDLSSNNHRHRFPGKLKEFLADHEKFLDFQRKNEGKNSPGEEKNFPTEEENLRSEENRENGDEIKKIFMKRISEKGLLLSEGFSLVLAALKDFEAALSAFHPKRGKKEKEEEEKTQWENFLEKKPALKALEDSLRNLLFSSPLPLIDSLTLVDPAIVQRAEESSRKFELSGQQENPEASNIKRPRSRSSSLAEGKSFDSSDLKRFRPERSDFHQAQRPALLAELHSLEASRNFRLNFPSEDSLQIATIKAAIEMLRTMKQQKNTEERGILDRKTTEEPPGSARASPPLIDVSSSPRFNAAENFFSPAVVCSPGPAIARPFRSPASAFSEAPSALTHSLYSSQISPRLSPVSFQLASPARRPLPISLQIGRSPGRTPSSSPSPSPLPASLGGSRRGDRVVLSAFNPSPVAWHCDSVPEEAGEIFYERSPIPINSALFRSLAQPRLPMTGSWNTGNTEKI